MSMLRQLLSALAALMCLLGSIQQVSSLGESSDLFDKIKNGGEDMNLNDAYALLKAGQHGTLLNDYSVADILKLERPSGEQCQAANLLKVEKMADEFRSKFGNKNLGDLVDALRKFYTIPFCKVLNLKDDWILWRKIHNGGRQQNLNDVYALLETVKDKEKTLLNNYRVSEIMALRTPKAEHCEADNLSKVQQMIDRSYGNNNFGDLINSIRTLHVYPFCEIRRLSEDRVLLGQIKTGGKRMVFEKIFSLLGEVKDKDRTILDQFSVAEIFALRSPSSEQCKAENVFKVERRANELMDSDSPNLGNFFNELLNSYLIPLCERKSPKEDFNLWRKIENGGETLYSKEILPLLEAVKDKEGTLLNGYSVAEILALGKPTAVQCEAANLLRLSKTIDEYEGKTDGKNFRGLLRVLRDLELLRFCRKVERDLWRKIKNGGNSLSVGDVESLLEAVETKDYMLLGHSVGEILSVKNLTVEQCFKIKSYQELSLTYGQKYKNKNLARFIDSLLEDRLIPFCKDPETDIVAKAIENIDELDRKTVLEFVELASEDPKSLHKSPLKMSEAAFIEKRLTEMGIPEDPEAIEDVKEMLEETMRRVKNTLDIVRIVKPMAVSNREHSGVDDMESLPPGLWRRIYYACDHYTMLATNKRKMKQERQAEIDRRNAEAEEEAIAKAQADARARLESKLDENMKKHKQREEQGKKQSSKFFTGLLTGMLIG